jgi:hypothetical protein
MRMEQTNGVKPTQGEQIDSVYELFILVVVIITLLMLAAYYLPSSVSQPDRVCAGSVCTWASSSRTILSAPCAARRIGEPT